MFVRWYNMDTFANPQMLKLRDQSGWSQIPILKLLGVRNIVSAIGSVNILCIEFYMSFTFTSKRFPEMEGSRSKQKRRKIASISEDYGDGDLELSDSDDNVEEIPVTRESKRDVSYISKSDSAVTESGWLKFVAPTCSK